MTVLQHGGSILGSVILCGTFRRISQLWDNAHTLNLENCLLCLPSTISQLFDFIRCMVFDFIFYCVAVHTLYLHAQKPYRYISLQILLVLLVFFVNVLVFFSVFFGQTVHAMCWLIMPLFPCFPGWDSSPLRESSFNMTRGGGGMKISKLEALNFNSPPR